MAEYPSRPGHVALGTIQVPWMLSGPAILAWYPAQFAYAAGLTGAGRTVVFGRTMTLLSGVACLGAACAARAVVVGVLGSVFSLATSATVPNGYLAAGGIVGVVTLADVLRRLFPPQEVVTA